MIVLGEQSRVSDDPPPEEVFDLLADEYARAILTATTDERKSATMLAETLEIAPSTVYDRTDRLCEADFLEEHTEIDETGNHYATYRTRLDRLDVRLTSDGFAVGTERTDRDAAADQLTDLWRNL